MARAILGRYFVVIRRRCRAVCHSSGGDHATRVDEHETVLPSFEVPHRQRYVGFGFVWFDHPVVCTTGKDFTTMSGALLLPAGFR